MERVELEKITARSVQVVLLYEGNHALDPFERKFICSLQYMATTKDMLGRKGGRLSSLTEKQMEILNRLASQHLPSLEDRPDAEAETKRSPRP